MGKEKILIRFELDGDTGAGTLNIVGSPEGLLFAVTAVISNLCEFIETPERDFVQALPRMLLDYKKAVTGAEGVCYRPDGWFDGGRE